MTFTVLSNDYGLPVSDVVSRNIEIVLNEVRNRIRRGNIGLKDRIRTKNRIVEER